MFDGHVARAVGTRDVPLEWAGKIGFLAAVTEEIEQQRAVIGLMGERFVYVPMPNSVDSRSAIAEQAARSSGYQPEMRAALAEAVRDFFATLDTGTVPLISDPDLAWLCAAADLASRARSPVLRESRNREIELVPEPELPARLVGEFTQLWRGLATIGATEDQARTVIHAALLGGIPKQRRNALVGLLADEGGVRTVQVAVRTRTPEATIRRSLEDLAALGVVDSDQGEREVWRADYWAPNDDARRQWAIIQARAAASQDLDSVDQFSVVTTDARRIATSVYALDATAPKDLKQRPSVISAPPTVCPATLGHAVSRGPIRTR